MSSTVRTILGALAAVAAIIAALLLIQTSASASVGTTFCDGKSQESVVVPYMRGAAAIPLRCGTATYGFNHLVQKGRWNAAFDSQIAQTISRGEESADRTIYATFNNTCVELFRAVVNPGAIGGTGFAPQGIITAYYRTYPTTAAAPDSTQASRERTDCPIIIPVNEP